GLGCGARLERKHLSLTAYFQDARSGEILTSTKRALIDNDKEISFNRQAAKPILKGVSLHDLAAGQLLAKSGKITATREYSLGRTGVSVNRQAFNWDMLRPPYYAETFRELQAIMAVRPPSLISARVSASNFFICPISAVEQAHFDVSRQMIVAIIRDSAGESSAIMAP